MKLTPQQLQYIDSYLKHNGVHYDDICYEMTDHVASAIEGMDSNFYDAFQEYMANHKKELLESNKMFKKLAFDKAISLLTTIPTVLPFHIITLLIFVTACFADSYAGEEAMAGTLHMALMLVSSVVVIDFWRHKIFSKTNHSVIDKLLTAAYFCIIIFRVDKFIDNAMLQNLYYAVCIAFFIVLVQSLYKLKKQYKVRYGS